MEKMQLDDATVATFLALCKLKVTPQKKPDGRVAFLIEGANINKALGELYANAPVGALDFIKTFKALRSSIFALKGGQR
jgi:hypothetical protein